MVESQELDEIKKLSPEERVRRLKELERKKEKELEQAKKLIRQSEIEIKDTMDEKERLPIDQLKAVGMDALITGEEKELFKIKHFTQEEPMSPSLEEITHAEPAKAATQEEYRALLSEKPIGQLYTQAKDLYSAGPGNVSQEQFYQALDLSYAVMEKEAAISSGKYSSDDLLMREVDATKKIVHEIMNWYKG